MCKNAAYDFDIEFIAILLQTAQTPQRAIAMAIAIAVCRVIRTNLELHCEATTTTIERNQFHNAVAMCSVSEHIFHIFHSVTRCIYGGRSYFFIEQPYIVGSVSHILFYFLRS